MGASGLSSPAVRRDGLHRALAGDAADELTRRLRGEPTGPTRPEVEEVLPAVVRYKATHTPPILVSGAPVEQV